MPPDDDLATRQHQLLDATLMRTVLSELLPRMLGEPATVESCTLDYFRPKPGYCVHCAYEMAVTLQSSHETRVHRVSCTAWPNDEVACQQFNAELSRLAARDPTASLSPSSAARPIAFVRDMQMVVRLLHVDPELLGLRHATDEAQVVGVLEKHLPECRVGGWHPVRVETEVLRYRPTSRCTLRYTVRLQHARVSDTQIRHVIGKVLRDERWQTCYAIQDAAWLAARASHGAWYTARPIAAVPDWHFFIRDFLPGRPFAQVFSAAADGRLHEPSLESAAVLLTAIARAARAMHTAPMPPGPGYELMTIVDSHDHHLADLERSQPDLAEELTRMRRTIARLDRRLPAPPRGFAHGDFAHKNILIDGDRIGIIDFDHAGQAEPGIDVAYFLTRLSGFLRRRPQWRPHATLLCEAFRDAYLSAAPDVSPNRLALCEGADLWVYILRKSVKQARKADWDGWVRQHIAIARARIREAARTADKVLS